MSQEQPDDAKLYLEWVLPAVVLSVGALFAVVGGFEAFLHYGLFIIVAAACAFFAFRFRK